ncbi:MAG: JAB domain-containing protein [Dehalococcoidales bacterium]
MERRLNNITKHLSDDDIRWAFYERFQVNPGEVIVSSKQAVQHLSGLIINRDREKFAVIYLNGANALINSEVIFEGSLTIAAVYPREIVKGVIDNGAASIIIGHNHPSGSIYPSPSDKEVTRKIEQACSTVDVILHDHIIIGYDKWFSFSDNGMLGIHPKFETTSSNTHG